jgi:hypothetical protein
MKLGAGSGKAMTQAVTQVHLAAIVLHWKRLGGEHAMLALQ